jgi:chloramphenicol 3-O phosphotransferase
MAESPSTGRAIVLNGGSSSGKSTIGRALQSVLVGDWLLIGIDVLIWLLPVEMVGSPAGFSVADGEIRRGPAFLRAYEGFQHSIAALCRAGQNVIIDEVLIDGIAGQRTWAASLAGIDAVWVGVRCEPDIAMARESERGDRPVGIAGHYADRVHRGVDYDIDVDTSAASLEDTLSVIVGALPDRWSVTPGVRRSGREALPPRSAWRADGSRSLAPWER